MLLLLVLMVIVMLQDKLRKVLAVTRVAAVDARVREVCFAEGLEGSRCCGSDGV